MCILKVQGNLLQGSSGRDMYLKCTKGLGAQKYLRESCYHHIKCSAANFLAAFMWRRLLNGIVLTIPTHRGSERVSDGTSIQVVAQMINKCRVKIVKRGLYNVRDPQWKGDRKNKKKRNTIAIRNQTCNRVSKAIYRNQSPRTLPRIFFLSVNLLSSFLCHQDLFTYYLIH